MNIEENAFVSIAYSLKIDSGEEVDRSNPDKPLGFVYGKGQIIPALEKQLKGLKQGGEIQFTVKPEDGYGAYRDDLKVELPRENFPPGVDIEPGMIFQGHGPQGPMNLRVIEADAAKVKGDFNHPLAGEQLHFDVQIIEVREATDDEIARAESHGCGPTACAGCSCEDPDSCGSH